MSTGPGCRPQHAHLPAAKYQIFWVVLTLASDSCTLGYEEDSLLCTYNLFFFLLIRSFIVRKCNGHRRRPVSFKINKGKQKKQAGLEYMVREHQIYEKSVQRPWCEF